MIQTTKLALRRYLAEEAFGFPRLRGFHGFASGHLRRHCATILGGHAHLHRTVSSQTAGRQPTNGQHGAEQQEEQRPQKFHGSDYSGAIAFTSCGISHFVRRHTQQQTIEWLLLYLLKFGSC